MEVRSSIVAALIVVGGLGVVGGGAGVWWLMSREQPGVYHQQAAADELRRDARQAPGAIAASQPAPSVPASPPAPSIPHNASVPSASAHEIVRTSSTDPQGTSRMVVINGQRLSDDEIAAAQKRSVRLMDGKYWYDRLTGAWGREGGPCAGFVTAGLKLGGPLRADASNGNTGVFINGRQLHFLDVVRLRQVIPVYPGRYWANAESSFGYEGGPAIGNIWLAVIGAMRGGGGGGGPVKREGILSTYDKTGVAVFGY